MSGVFISVQRSLKFLIFTLNTGEQHPTPEMDLFPDYDPL
jgi:hypothetical protein